MDVNILVKSFAIVIILILTVLAGLRWKSRGMAYREGVLWLAAAVLFLCSVITLFNGEVCVAHDTIGTMSRIQGMAEAIRGGQFPILILPNQANEYGCAGILYPHLLFYIPALIHLSGASIVTSYQMFILFIQIMSFVVIFTAVRLFEGSESACIIAAAFFSCFPYRLSDLYWRGALAEASAMVFIPLLLASLYRISKDDSGYNRLFLCLSVTGLIQTHILTLVIAAIVAVPYALINIKKYLDKNKIFSILIGGIVEPLLLNAWYIIPFLKFYGLESNISDLKNEMAEYAVPFTEMLWGRSFHDSRPGIIGIFGIVMIVADTVYIIKRHSDGKRGEGSSFVGTAVYMYICMLAGILMSTKYFPWAVLQRVFGAVGIFQFPFRFLVITSTLGCILFGFAFDDMTREAVSRLKKIRGEKAFCAAAVLALSAVEIISAVNIYNCRDLDEQFDNTVNDFTFDYRTEYLPKGMDSSYFADKNPVFDETIVTDYYYKDVSELVWKYSDNIPGSAQYFEAPLTYYPGYTAAFLDEAGNYVTNLDITGSDNYRVNVLLPDSYTSGTVVVRYTGIWYFKISNIVSLISLILLAGAAVMYGRTDFDFAEITDWKKLGHIFRKNNGNRS